MPAPKVSVIIPSFCAAATLPVAVQSVLDQDFADFELLIVDDGSPDHSATVARRVAVHDARIRVIVQPHGGPAAARNRGLREARGELVAFLDADDRWTRDLLRRHLDHFSRDRRCGVSFARIRYFDPMLQRAGRMSAHVPMLSLAQTLGEHPVCTTSNIVARRNVFGEADGFDPSLARGEDQEWVARVLATTAWRVCGLPQVLVHYRASLLGLSADLDRMRDGWMTMLRHVGDYAPHSVARVEHEAAALFYRFLARSALRTGQGRLSLRPMLRALAESPRALLINQPHRTAFTIACALAAQLPGYPARALLTRSSNRRNSHA